MLKVTISLEEDILQFVDQYAQGNRSAYINTLLAEHRRRILATEMITALKQMQKIQSIKLKLLLGIALLEMA